MSEETKKDVIEHQLKQAIKRKDEFAVMILTTRLNNMGYHVQFTYGD